MIVFFSLCGLEYSRCLRNHRILELDTKLFLQNKEKDIIDRYIRCVLIVRVQKFRFRMDDGDVSFFHLNLYSGNLVSYDHRVWSLVWGIECSFIRACLCEPVRGGAYLCKSGLLPCS